MLKSPSKWIQKVFHVSLREFRLVLVVCLLFLASGLIYVWPNVEMVHLAYEFQKEKRLHRELMRENVLLKLERGSLQSLDRVQYLAESQLGMKEPASGQVVSIILN